MLGNVERYLLTPVVLRFARKYIKNVEGAAATDLQVSLSGGSLVFRNFELNLEEVVKNLPCSVVRTFARELQIKIPWTSLATDPIEIVLDTVECVFAKGKGPWPAPGDASEKDGAERDASKGEDADPGDPEASAQTWVGSLLQSALANVTVRVKNSVVKYIADGAVATVSVESAVAYSVGKDWQQAFTDPLLGLRRMCALNNISVCLDELDPFGRVAEYQEALLKERSVTVRLSLVPARGGNKARRCEAEVVVGPLDASVSNSQLEQLRRIVSGFRSGSGEVRGSAQNGTEKKEAEEKDADGSSAEVTRVARKDKDRSGLQSKALEAEENRQSSDESDGSGEDDLDERNPDERNPDGSGHDPLKSSALVQAAAAGWRPIGWAWNFLANEEATAGAAEAAAQRREALQQMEEEADVLGLLGSGGPLDLAFRLKLTGGEVKLRHVPPPTVEKTSVRRSDAGRALSEEDEASEKDDDSMTVVDKAVIEQSLSPPTAGVFIPTPDLFSSLPDVRSPHFRATEPGAKARFAVLSWGGLSVDVDVAQEALRSVSVRLDWAQVTKPNDGTSDVLLAILPDREGGKVAVRRRLSFPGSPFSNPGVDSAKPSSKLNAHAEKSRATEEQRPTPSVATKFQSASSSLALPQFATPSAESPFNEATSPERKALQITWQSGERPTNLGDVRNDGAPRLQAVVGHVAVAYSPGLVAGLKSFLNRGRNGMEPADVIVGQDDDDGLGRGREAGSSEDVSTAERSAPGGYSEADGTVIKSPLPEESSRPGKIPFFGRVRESASGLPAFEVSVDSCELAAVGADSEAGSPAVVLCTGQLECRFSDVLDGAKEVEGGGGRAVKVVLREVKADAVPDWAHQQECTQILDPVTLSCSLSLPESPPGTALPGNARISIDSDRFHFRLGGPECLLLARVADGTCFDLTGKQLPFQLPEETLYQGTWLALRWTGASLIVHESGSEASALAFQSLEAELLGSKISISPRTGDIDSIRVIMTAAEGVGRRCTIAVGQVATVVDLQSLQALRAFRSIDTAVNSRKQEETEAPSSSVKSPSQTEGVVTSPALFGLFDTVTLEISNVQLNVASARSQSEDKPPLVIAPTFALAKISLSVKCTPSQSASRDSLPSASGRSDQEAIVTTVTWRVTSASARLLCLSGGTPVDLGTPLLHLDDVSGSIEREEWRDGALEAHSRKANVLRIRALSGGLTRQQHVALLLFLKGASSSHVSPEASGHVGSGPAAPASATAPPSATCLVESNSRIEIDGVDLKLGLWTDGDDVCWPEAPLGESSVLRIVGSGFRIEDVETLSKRDRPSTHSAWMNPLSGPRDSVPEDSARSYSAAHPRPELLEKEKAVTVVLEDLKVLLDRRANRTESTESPPSAAELPEIVDTILERRPGKEPPFEVTWRSRGDQPGKLEVTLAELDWRLDAQLIQEFITLAFERRKHFPNPGGPDVLPAIPTVRIVAGAYSCHVLSSLEAFHVSSLTNPSRGIHTPAFGALLFSESSVTLVSPGVDSDVRQWAGVHDSSEPLNPSTEARALEVDFSLLGIGLSLLESPVGTPLQTEPQSKPQSFPQERTSQTLPQNADQTFFQPPLNPLQTALPFLLPRDLRLGITVMGCPFPLSLRLDTRHLELAACGERISILQGLFGSLLGGWSATWPLRLRCAGPVLPADDLRCGLFKKARGDTMALPGPGEVGWGDGAGEGWIAWSYPYPRAVRQILIDLRTLSSDLLPLTFHVSYQADPERSPILPESSEDPAWISCATVTSADATPTSAGAFLLIATDSDTQAVSWRLSWHPATGADPAFADRNFSGGVATALEVPPRNMHPHSSGHSGPPSGAHSSPELHNLSSTGDETSARATLLRAVDMLRLVQVNPTGNPAILSPVPSLPVLAPLTIELTADSFELGLLHRAKTGEDEERGAVSIRGLRLGYHWWASTAMTLAVVGEWSGEYVDTACQTYERLVEPVECALVADICSVLLPGTPLDPLDPPSKSPASAAPFLEGFPVTHPRKAPASLGYSLDVRTEGDVRIRLQKSGLEEAQRRWGKKEVAEGESLGAGEEGSARMESRVQQGGESCAQKVVEGDAKSGEQMVMGDPASDVAHGNPAIVLRNDSPVPLHFGQLDTDEALLVCPGGALSYTWAAPPVLVPGAKRKLRVRIAAPSVGEARNDVGPASSWSEAFSLKASDSDGVGRRVVIDGRGVAQLVVKICKGEKGEWNVTVSPGLRFVNRTAGALSIRYRGLLPGGRSDQAELNDGVELMNPRQTRSPSKRDQHAEPKGVEEVEKAGGGNKLQKRSSRNQFASQWHTGERILTIPPTGGKVPGVGVLLVTPRDSDVSGDVSDDERHVAPSVSVLLGSTAEREEAQSEGAIWSPWLGLDNPPQGSPSLHLLTVDTQSTPVRGVQRGLPSVWCQVVSSPEGRLTLTVWPLFMAYNGLHRSVDLRVGEDGFESVSVRISEQEEVPLRALTSGVDSVAFRLAAEGGNSSGTIAALESNQERFGLADERGLPGTDGAATEKELIEGGSGTDIEVGAWSVPLMLAAGASVPGAGGVLESGTIGEDFRIPSLGAVRHLALNGEEKELGCVLASEPFSPDVPTVVLSLLPYAVLHNATHHPVCIAAVSPRGETTPVATARPDGHVAFSWPSASPDGRPRRVRRAKIGLSFGLGDRRGDLSASLGGAPEAKARGGAEAGESGPLEGGAEEAFVWSSPVSLDEGGIHEGSVWVPAGDLVAECCFLVRIENVSHNDASNQSPGHVTCHVSIYPWALASNLTPYPLHLHPSHATYPGAPPAAFLVWPAQILSGGQKEAHVLVRRLVKEPPPELTPGLSSITYPSLLETPTSRIGLDVGALESVERTAWSQGPLEPGSIVGTPGGGAGDADFGAGRGDVSERNVQRLGLSCPPGKAQALSPPFQLGAPATQRCMLLTSSPGGHDVMLTWHVVSADGQAHLVLHEDAQPPGAVRNESDATLEVRKASEDGEEENVPTLVAPRHVAHFDWEGLAGLGGGGDVEEEMDEALLVQMRQGGRGVKLQIRVGNGPWSEPFNTDGPQSFECSLSSNGMAAGVGKVEALSEERKTESGRSGVVKGDEKAPGEKGRVGEKLRPSETRGLEDLLTVQVERQGATCCILVRRSERQSATENPEAETSGADRSEAESRTTQEVALPSNLAVSLSLGSLQAALYDDESRLLRGPVSAAETPPQNNPALAFLFTLDGLRLAASRVSSLRPVGLPPVTSYNCHVAVAALQLDNHLPGAKLPVILTVDLGETGLAAATLRGHPSSKTDPFPAARCSVIFSQPVPSPSAGLSAAWVQNLDVQIQPLVLNIDDSLLALITRLRRPHSPADALEPAAKSVRHPQSQGLLVRTSDLALADPQLYVHSLAVSDVRLALTACVTRPVVLDVRAAPVRLSELELRTVLFPSVVLARGILGHYVTEAICNVHRVVGSLELLFNPTGLVKSVRAGLRDLIQLPLQGSQSGPFGFLWGLGAGGASLSRHVSRWTLASVAGFSSSLSRILTQAGGRSPRQNAPPLEELGHSGQALSSEGPMSPKTGAPSGGVLSGVRRGLVGVLVAPLQLVAQTSSGLLGRETGPQPRLLRVSSSLSVTSESVNTGGLEEEAIEEGSPVRSTMRRLRGHVLPGERFMRHAEVNSLTVVRVTGPVEDVRPVVVNRGSLLLSDTAVYVLECGGARLAARLPLNGLSLEEDHASYEIVMVADSSAEQNLIACNESERQTRSASVQVLARLDRETWHAIVPVLKERLL